MLARTTAAAPHSHAPLPLQEKKPLQLAIAKGHLALAQSLMQAEGSALEDGVPRQGTRENIFAVLSGDSVR